jgi:hypothetical protein
MQKPLPKAVPLVLLLWVACADPLPTDHAMGATDAFLSSQAIAAHGGRAQEHGIEAFPAYYNDTVVTVMMGPSGNSANPNQLPSPHCWGLGPDVSRAAQPMPLAAMYALFVPRANQMQGCEQDDGLTHDMVLSAVPGDRGYGPRIIVFACAPGENFVEDNMPYTSAPAVEQARAKQELACGPLTVLVSPVIRGPHD